MRGYWFFVPPLSIVYHWARGMLLQKRKYSDQNFAWCCCSLKAPKEETAGKDFFVPAHFSNVFISGAPSLQGSIVMLSDGSTLHADGTIEHRDLLFGFLHPFHSLSHLLSSNPSSQERGSPSVPPLIGRSRPRPANMG